MPVYPGVASKQASRMKATEDKTCREIEELSDRERGGQTTANRENRVIIKL
jgi:hypothetical protein